MEVAMNAVFSSLNPTFVNQKPSLNLRFPDFSYQNPNFPPQSSCQRKELSSRSSLLRRDSCKPCPAVSAALSGLENVETSSLKTEDVSFTVSESVKPSELKIHVEASGAKTRAVFDDVFDKMVAAAQPIPGFRRVKGGKTPNIPRDILLEILGPSKVYKQVINKMINATIAEYVEKNGLKVRKDLTVDQSFEDLEEAFEPDESFSFDAVIKLQETN